MTTGYAQNGLTQFNAITFDDRFKFALCLSSDQRLVLVSNLDLASGSVPIEALAFNPTTNVLSAQGVSGQLVQFVIPRFSSTTLPTANVTGAIAYATDNNGLYFNSGATWVQAAFAVPLLVTQGGTGVTTITSGGVLVGAGTAALTVIVPASGSYIKGAGAAGITTQATPIPVADGGTGLATIPVGSVVAGSGTAAATALTLTSGQLVVGSSGAVPVATLPVAGTGLVVATTTGGLTLSPVSYVLDRQVAATSVGNTTGTVTFYSKTINGGTLGSTQMLRLSMIGDYENSGTGGASNPILTITFGASTAFSATPLGPATVATRLPITVDFRLSAANTTNKQVASGNLWLGPFGVSGVALPVGATQVFATATIGALLYGLHNNLTINTSAAQTIAMTWQNGVVDPSTVFRAYAVQLELV